VEEEEQTVKDRRYSELKEGETVSGAVRSLTDYGAFVSQQQARVVAVSVCGIPLVALLLEIMPELGNDIDETIAIPTFSTGTFKKLVICPAVVRSMAICLSC